MRHAPVYYTLIQVRFNPLLALDSYVAKIQDQLRRREYPDTQKGVMAAFNLNIVGGAGGSNSPPPPVPVTQTTRYSFSNVQKTAGFILDQAALTYHATEYEDFANFAGEFLKGLSIVHEEVELSYTDRIGLRYLDAVFPKEKENLSEYLEESV